MLISQKCQYSLRAIFELAKQRDRGPIRIADIAAAQAIPVRFLEVILSQLKQGGFVGSQRGKHGGYLLIRPPGELTIGEVIRFVEGPLGPVVCGKKGPTNACPLHGTCVFLPMWEKVRAAISGVYDSTTFRDLVEREAEQSHAYVPSYAI